MSDFSEDRLLWRVNEVMSSADAAHDEVRGSVLLAQILERVHGENAEVHKNPYRELPKTRSGKILASVGLAAAVVALVVGTLSVVGGGSRLKNPETTAWQGGTTLTTTRGGGIAPSRHGTWLLGDSSGAPTGTWQQTADGPPGGSLSCPTSTACYKMSEMYASDVERAKLLSVSFYSSSDVGVSWTKYVMPSGFVPTTDLSCGDKLTCVAGGTYNGQSVLVSTTNGGHSFTVAPLPPAVGTYFSLSCVASGYCAGLASTEGPQSAIAIHSNTLRNGAPSDATFVATDDDGSTFTSTSISANNSLWKIDCTSSLNCIALGDQGAAGTPRWAQGVVEVTNDGGATWTSALLPTGFAVQSDSALSCADALHCSVTGFVNVPFENPPSCLAKYPNANSLSLPDTAGTPTGELEDLVAAESANITTINLQTSANSPHWGCSSPAQTPVSEVFSTTDGGMKWTVDPLPSNVLDQQIFGLSCPTDNECWASGWGSTIAQDANGIINGDSILLGTIDGGPSWSPVTFDQPTGDFDPGIVTLSCPSAGVCAGGGIGQAGSQSVPFFSLVAPSSET